MPTSKHRRKGKLRPRDKVNPAIPPRPVINPEEPWRQEPALIAQLQKMYGNNGGRDWTDEQIDAAFDEVDREETAIFLAWAEQRAGPKPPQPQQLELFPVNSLEETN